jgi:RimJ/RimL family protein N-acetyltransferase
MTSPRSTHLATPPVLETERLVLTAHSAEMFESLCAMWSDPAVVRYIGGRPATRRESWMRMLSYRGCWPLLGYGYWAICEKASGRYVGDLGFADFHRDLDPPIRGTPEAGWALATWAHGKGFATEALNAALAWLDRHTPHDRSVCVISPDNQVSIRMAEKAGFTDPKPTRLNDHSVLLYARTLAAAPQRND